MNETIQRGKFNEIQLQSLPKSTRKIIKNLVNKAADAKKIDEHGGWDFGCEFDRKGRGSALNWDLYGYGLDYHSRRFLCVIQVRQAFRRSTKYFLNVRKSYFLLGRNEDDTVFAHPVESKVIHNAINKNSNLILAIQNWIFNCDYRKVIRQGDLALIPIKKTPIGEDLGSPFLIEKSHQLSSEKILQNDNLYALNPNLEHIVGVHPNVNGKGWYKIMIGKRSSYWKFASPTID